ncbi:DNA-binding response regulator [Citricoccus sp. GCM10030269]|uniref:helix-turn-helix transcriptional regulator n=1 Tax=Citricoccus sp. GCM10030269 TaxID=3273388 RepID=UPI0036072D98
MKPVHVMLVSAQPLILRALTDCFDGAGATAPHSDTRSDSRSEARSVGQFKVTTVLSSVDEAVAVAPDLKSHVVVLDTENGVNRGSSAVVDLLSANPRLRILALTFAAEPGAVVAILRAGAIGAVSNVAKPADILTAAAATATEPLVLSPDLQFMLAARAVGRTGHREAEALSPAAQRLGVTKHEAEAISYLAQGLNNHEIAEAMFVSASSVKAYLKGAKRKVGARDKVQLLVRSYELGLTAPRRAPERLD